MGLMVKAITASFVAAVLSYSLVRLAITNQSDLSSARIGFAIVIFTISFSLVYLGFAKVLRISEISSVLALARRK
jgi:hypothetical protein